MISVEKSRMNFDRALSQFVIQLIGCGMTPGETLDDGITIKNEPAPFLVLEYADVSLHFEILIFEYFYRMVIY